MARNGKLVWELCPAVPSDKGDAVRRVISESNASSVVVAGNDLGDLPAFAAAPELKTRDGDVIRVAVDSAEAPPALIEQPGATGAIGAQHPAFESATPSTLLGTGHLADPYAARKVSVDERRYTGLALCAAEIADVVVQQTMAKKDHSSAAFIRHLTPEAF